MQVAKQSLQILRPQRAQLFSRINIIDDSIFSTNYFSVGFNILRKYT